jgi:hypothetical protein
VLDEQLRVVWGNKGFLDRFDVGADIFGRPFEDLWNGKTEQPELWTLLEDTVIHGRPFAHIQTVVAVGPPVERPVWFSAHRLPQDPRDTSRPPLTLVMLEDAGG